MLEMTRQIGLFLNFNPRTEKHGQENVPGADLKISIVTSNDILSEFHPTLKALLFRKPSPGEEDLVDKGSEEPGHTRLVFGNKIHAIKWDAEIVGAQFTVHYGTGGKSDIALEDTTIDSFTIEPMDGGTVVLTFRVKCNPDEKAGGKLFTIMGSEVEFSIVPPEDAQDAA